MIAFDNNVLVLISAYIGVIVAVFWLAMIIWAYRDMRSRSRDLLAQVLVGVVVALLNVPGLFVYILLRPRETLSEAYERSLEEEALLQEIEEKPTCPGCAHRVQPEWQACPYCHTRLKKPCIACQSMLELSWTLCPHCATSQSSYVPEERILNASRHVRVQAQPPDIPDKWLAGKSSEPATRTTARTTDSLEFVDSDEY